MNSLRAAGFNTAQVLDAGCGTGRHAAALIERGHDVTLLDASEALITIARKRCPDAPAVVTDLCEPAIAGAFDAVIARGVLNDLLTDGERADALNAFARLTRAGGVLVLDVREAAMSQQRADGIWRTTEVDLQDGSQLRFISRPTWNDGRIVVEERYELASDHDETPEVSEFLFEMRPWTREELQRRLSSAGYGRIEMRDGVGDALRTDFLSPLATRATGAAADGTLNGRSYVAATGVSAALNGRASTYSSPVRPATLKPV